MKHPATISTACFLTVALGLTSGCSQSVPNENNTETVEDTEQRTTQETIIAELLLEMPDHAPFVDEQGLFDTDAAVRYVYENDDITVDEAIARAEQMEREWDVAYVVKTREVTTRV